MDGIGVRLVKEVAVSVDAFTEEEYVSQFKFVMWMSCYNSDRQSKHSSDNLLKRAYIWRNNLSRWLLYGGKVEDDDEINDSLPKDKEPDYMQSAFRIRVLDVKDKMLSRLHVAIIQSWYRRECYVKSMADFIQKELQSFGSPEEVMIFFSAHGVTETYVRDDGDLYRDQMEEWCKESPSPPGKLLADIVSTLEVPRPEAVRSINRTMPIREACHVDVQRIQPGKQRPRKHAQARQHAKGQGPTPVSLVVPEGKGVSSSASVEVASMQVVAPAHVENSVVGAACGVMDQMASACCEANKLLAMVFQFPMSENRSLYGKMIKSTASDISSQSYSNCNGNNIDELEEYEIELLHAEAFLDYLCNLTPHNLKLSDTLSGEAFLTKYDHHNDPVTLKSLWFASIIGFSSLWFAAILRRVS
ncbi:L-arabinokinase-like protein isoform X2 [Tanacetum coccineum]